MHFFPLQHSELKSKQRSRRQRELLTLFVAVVDRLVTVERQLAVESTGISPSHKQLEWKARRTALVLSNISQLLHFISKDVDLQQIFQVSL